MLAAVVSDGGNGIASNSRVEGVPTMTVQQLVVGGFGAALAIAGVAGVLFRSGLSDHLERRRSHDTSISSVAYVLVASATYVLAGLGLLLVAFLVLVR